MTPTRIRQGLKVVGLALSLTATAVIGIELSSRLLDYIGQEYGQDARSRLERWEDLQDLASKAPVERQLRLVNSFFNQVRFVNDIEHWDTEDYWATPVELLATNGGDCEDFSIAKYLTLRALDVPDDQLRITYVKAIELNQAHMVLAWYPTPDADPLILDNLINEIRPASKRTDLEPVYSFNGKGLWLQRLGDEAQRIGNADKLERWTDLNNRLIDSLR
ncbi:transglutaminase-like cysteine peptidase [Marinobacter nanhaiticus D15-8W]|uniref:Sulfate adenylyltransferase n=1 Tax=Marinobacter nanhaiticus D15-8W TaxID=626887 RepID=N6WSA7_9GAMM|nr:transglutaminase-like cysteine peptidase [Marinobacter nanhaiticus]ENO13917.1 sulfate adenylyltransferase [Marinobacter nanhaiticus D15-8W]BES71294.1 transglutaminase-like cysteine peptidase [Marinobacter nanhaiticus D15-8W]